MKQAAIDFDMVLDLCRDSHRRIILAVLIEEQRSLTVNDLTKTILKHNHQTSITEVPKEELTKIQLSLVHTHLPKVEMEGVIEYDRERQIVEPTEQFDQLQPYLSAIINLDPGLEEPVAL
jgi:DNA-binding transcriptional ArsR family regulator